MTLPRLAKAVLHGALGWVWPRRCLHCQNDIPDDTPGGFCPACVRTFSDEPHPICPRCATGVGEFADLEAGCIRCRKERYSFIGTVRLGAYAGPLRDMVLRVKQPGQDTVAEELGATLARCRGDVLRQIQPQAIVPVPLHWKRRLVRRYNQAHAIAWGVGGVLHVPVVACIRRVRATAKQTEQSPTARRTNVAGAFAPKAGAVVRGLRVLLIDDVFTTGATANAAAQAILAAGAAQVHVAVLAHR